MKVLVTGGLGYIGSHTVVELLNNNDEVIVVESWGNRCNLQGLQVDGAEAVACITVGEVVVLVLKVVGVFRNF